MFSEFRSEAETGMLIRDSPVVEPHGEGFMLGREDELHLLGFLTTLAGLLGIVVGVSQFQVASASSATVRAYFSVLLVVFLFASALAYLGALQDRDVASFNRPCSAISPRSSGSRSDSQRRASSRSTFNLEDFG